MWFEVLMLDMRTIFNKIVKNVYEVNEKKMCCYQIFQPG